MSSTRLVISSSLIGKFSYPWDLHIVNPTRAELVLQENGRPIAFYASWLAFIQLVVFSKLNKFLLEEQSIPIRDMGCDTAMGTLFIDEKIMRTDCDGHIYIWSCELKNYELKAENLVGVYGKWVLKCNMIHIDSKSRISVYVELLN